MAEFGELIGYWLINASLLVKKAIAAGYLPAAIDIIMELCCFCLLHNDACIFHLLSLFGKGNVVDARIHAVGSHGY